MVLNIQGLRPFWQAQVRVDGSMLSLFVYTDKVTLGVCVCVCVGVCFIN